MCVLSSGVNLIGEQNDVQHVSMSAHMLIIFGRFETVPTYGTAPINEQSTGATLICRMGNLIKVE